MGVFGDDITPEPPTEVNEEQDGILGGWAGGVRGMPN